MENASKALLMAGGVLISLIIVSALVLMFNSLSSYRNSDIQDSKEAQILEFNNQYSSYARNDVKGNDIYSLLNKVVDYNTRNSSEGYQPMAITVTIRSTDLNELYMGDNYNHLIKPNSGQDVKYTVIGTNNGFQEVENSIKTLENKYGGRDVLTKLVTSMTGIFIEDSSSDSKKKEAVDKYNKISTKNRISSFEEIKEDSEKREEVYKYREYVQFKRAKFNCTSAVYDDKGTGRIISMEFVSNGKF